MINFLNNQLVLVVIAEVFAHDDGGVAMNRLGVRSCVALFRFLTAALEKTAAVLAPNIDHVFYTHYTNISEKSNTKNHRPYAKINHLL